MEFKIQTLKLREALALVSPAVSKKAYRPVLTTVKITADENIVIEATDMEQRIAVKISDGIEIKEQGHLCVAAKFLQDYVKEVTTEEVTLKFLGDTNQLRISAGRSRLHFNVVDPASFPTDLTQDATFFNADGKGLLYSLRKVFSFASKDETRAFLMTACISGGDIVATDGHRLAMVTDPDMNIADENLLIPKSSVPSILKLFENVESLNIALGDNKLYFQSGNILFSTRLIAKDYPNYMAVIPTGQYRTVRGSRDEFLSAVKRLLLIYKNSSDNRVCTIKMSFQQDNIALTATSASSGEGAEIIEATGFEDDTMIGFNGNYLKEALESLEEDTFELHVRESLRPAVFKEGKYTHVVMPIKI